MGFIEETGAAQYYRDARILPIYEGTTAIQANDLVGRKTLRDQGAAAQTILAAIDETIAALAAADAGDAAAACAAMQARLTEGRNALARVVAFVLERGGRDPNAVFAGSVPYLKLAGIVLSGWQMARALLASVARRREDPAFHGTKIATAHFFAEHLLPQAAALEASILATGAVSALCALREDQF
jgi:hypothetical protein